MLAVSLAACGGNDVLSPGSGDDPGEGTATLVVDGRVRAEPRIANARERIEFDTHFSVDIRLNGQDVTTGDVTIEGASGLVALVYDANNNGEWTGEVAGYDEVYILNVVSGDDRVEGVRVDGPDPHVFTSPTAGATVDSTMPIEIKWSRGDEAESSSIRAEQIDNVAIPDSGTYMLAAGALKAERDKPHENDIRISRENHVVPSGAAGGSIMRVSITNEVRVVAQPNPGL